MRHSVRGVVCWIGWGWFLCVWSADNSRQSSHVSVFIHLLDVNDNAPTFATVYETFVCERTKAGQVAVCLSVCFSVCQSLRTLLDTKNTLWSTNTSSHAERGVSPSLKGQTISEHTWNVADNMTLLRKPEMQRGYCKSRKSVFRTVGSPVNLKVSLSSVCLRTGVLVFQIFAELRFKMKWR